MAFFRFCDCIAEDKSIAFQVITEKGNVGGKNKKPPANNYYEAEGLINRLLCIAEFYVSKPVKDFHQYLTGASDSHVSHEEYLKAPAVAFLKYTVEAKSAIDLCTRYFQKNQAGEFKKDSLDSLQHLITASLPTIMGHFETYQRYLFAGIFDMSVLLKNFDSTKFFRAISDKTNIEMDWVRLSAHRGIGATSIGTLLADSMSGWHDPERVNSYFSAYKLPYAVFGNDSQEKLRALWQLRHSIVHTGGTLSRADAQKVNSLKEYGGKQIAFEKKFHI